jgi:hypothetical protein
LAAAVATLSLRRPPAPFRAVVGGAAMAFVFLASGPMVAPGPLRVDYAVHWGGGLAGVGAGLLMLWLARRSDGAPRGALWAALAGALVIGVGAGLLLVVALLHL